MQTVIREQPPGLHHGGGDQTSTVLRVGTRVVPLTDGSLPDAESGDRVTAALVPAAGGARRVLVAAHPGRRARSRPCRPPSRSTSRWCSRRG